MDKASILGLAIGVLGILLGNALDGGHVNALLSFTAFLIVFSGTMGAMVLSNTTSDLKIGFELLKSAFVNEDQKHKSKIAQEIIESAQLARKETLLSIEPKIESMSDPFMKNVFKFMVDGVEASTIRDVFEGEMDLEERRLQAGAKIWADAGGFAPTIGIIGAVLGLIHVMSNLTDTAQLGRGIAIAFVATIYGVASANLFFLPLSNKLKSKIQRKMESKEMILEGAVAIVSGLNPYVIEQKVKNYLEHE